MRLCVFTEPQQGATYDELLRVARGAEALGFEGFFRSDHYLSMGDGSGLLGSTDAWITLAGLARDTSGSGSAPWSARPPSGIRSARELRRRAERLGRQLDELRANGLAGSPAEVAAKLGEFAGIGAGRAYLQLMDLADLDQLELIAAEVAPQL